MDIFGNFSNLVGDKKKRKALVSNYSDFSYTDPVLEGQSKLERRETKSERLPFSKFLILAVFIILCVKLFTLQVVDASKNQDLALGNSIRPRSILSTRGIITDANGTWLARNKPSFALGVYPSDVPKKKSDRENFYKELAVKSGLSESDIKVKIEANGLSSIELVVLKSDLSREDALILEENIFGMPGVVVDARAVREYKSDSGLAHILGYTGLVSDQELKENSEYLRNEDTGKMGIEKTYQNYLRGNPGVEAVEVDSKGQVVRTLVDTNNRPPQMGSNLTLNIDYPLQQVMTNELAAGIASVQNVDVTSGVVVALNPNTGAVLGLVSLPSYDNNIFSGELNNEEYQKLLDDKALPLLNRATLGTYPSGSVIKIVMAAAGLQEGIINKNTSIETPPEITVGQWKFPDWKWHSGVTDVKRAIAESNNIFFYALAGGWDKIKGLGVEKLGKYLSLFGFGSKTGIDLPNEAAGLVPSPDWKEKYKKENWYLGDTYHMGIGQGDLLVTPLQMVKAMSAVANGGKLITPQIVKEVTNSDGQIVKTFEPKIERQGFISDDNIRVVQEGMRQCVISGSGKVLQDLSVSSAAKTGTAQFFNNQKTHAWFEAYAPYENPQIAIVVLVEGGGGGYEVAGPITNNILKYYFGR
ncbi:MAG: penicillin-binding protein 2 [Patescibacteria group bacterium]